MIPTHRHADGGLYRLAATDIAGKDDGEWVPGVLYQCVIDAKIRWTSQRRFNERFKPIPKGDTKHDRINLFEDNEVVATFIFAVTEIDDIRHMLIKGKPVGDDDQLFQHVRRVLSAQAEIMSQGLHRDTAPLVDFLGDVMTFHRKFAQFPNRDGPLLPQDLFDFRAKFHLEESQEYKDCGEVIYSILETRDPGVTTEEERRHIMEQLANQLDAICDTLFVVFGTVDIQFDRHILYEAWRRVMAKNMQKVRAYAEGDDRSKRDSKFDIVKPTGWTPPDHTDLIKL